MARNRKFHPTLPISEIDRIIGIDPGSARSGVAMLELDIQPSIVAKGDWMQNPMLWIALRTISPLGTIVICESFKIYKWAAKSLIGSSLEEVRCIGRIEEICEVRNIPLWLVPASAHKESNGHDMLKEMGLWHRSDHVRDALSVAVYGLFKLRGDNGR